MTKCLIRVKDFDLESQDLYVIIPEWDPSKVITIWLGKIRKDLPKYWPKDEDYLLANVDLTAYKIEDLKIKDFESI